MCQQCDELIGELDKIVSSKQRPLEGHWNTDIWQDFLLQGTEAVGTVLTTRKTERFKARSLIAWNTSGLTFFVSGGIVIPRNISDFTARVKPPRDIFEIKVAAAVTTTPGELHIWLTEELLEPTAGYL